MAICCEVEAVNYVETSAVKKDNSEALQLCALATMKHVNNNNNNNNNNTNNFRRSPSIQGGPTGFNTGNGNIINVISEISSKKVGDNRASRWACQL